MPSKMLPVSRPTTTPSFSSLPPPTSERPIPRARKRPLPRTTGRASSLSRCRVCRTSGECVRANEGGEGVEGKEERVKGWSRGMLPQGSCRVLHRADLSSQRPSLPPVLPLFHLWSPGPFCYSATRSVTTYPGSSDLYPSCRCGPQKANSRGYMRSKAMKEKPPTGPIPERGSPRCPIW